MGGGMCERLPAIERPPALFGGAHPRFRHSCVGRNLCATLRVGSCLRRNDGEGGGSGVGGDWGVGGGLVVARGFPPPT